jgi:hypothetical protein
MNIGADEEIVFFGSSVKALGAGKVGGLIAPFRKASAPDVQGDFFTKSTDFGLDVTDRARVVYHHGFTKALGTKKLGVATLTLGDEGLEGVAQLDLSIPAVKALYARAEAGELYWSSATSPHLRVSRSVKGANEITGWPVIEVSLTHSPVDDLARVVSMKAIIDSAMKGEHLGEHAERHAAMSALSSLHGSLMDRVGEHLRDAKKPKAEKLAACKGCYDEHHEAAMKCLKAMIPGDEKPASASMKSRAERLISLG